MRYLWPSLGTVLVLAACSTGAAPGHVDLPPNPWLLVDASSDDAQYPIFPGDDASAPLGAVVSCPSRNGYFACGNNVCDRAIQACFSGSACVSYQYAAPACGACPTCECLKARTALNIESCHEDADGSITVALYPFGGPGTPCTVDYDCIRGLCMNGVCECQPAGAVATARGDQNDCCSRSGGMVTSADGGDGPFVCAAARGAGCSMTVPDCYGGRCVGGVCACVGPGASCTVDTDCCAGATRCVFGATGGACR